MDNVTTIIVSALVGAVVAAAGAAIQNALTLRAKIDESLRLARLEVYKLLWKKTELLPKWPRANDVTYDKLGNLSKEFRDWYFGTGGIYLSKRARKAYEAVQTGLCQLVEANSANAVENISGTEYDLIRDYCSALRTELTRDLQSRKRSFLSGG